MALHGIGRETSRTTVSLLVLLSGYILLPRFQPTASVHAGTIRYQNGSIVQHATAERPKLFFDSDGNPT